MCENRPSAALAWTPALLRSLTDHGVPFVIVGGVAAVVHGSAYAEQTLEICAARDSDSARALLAALAPHAPRWRDRPDVPTAESITAALAQRRRLYLISDLGRLNVLGELPGVGTYEDALRQSTVIEFRGIACHVLDLDPLIATKLVESREDDQPALRELHVICERMRLRDGKPPA